MRLSLRPLRSPPASGRVGRSERRLPSDSSSATRDRAQEGAEERPRRTSHAIALALVLISCNARAADTAFDEPSLHEAVIDAGDEVGPFPHARGRDVLTQRNDNQRTGASHWPGLNQSSRKIRPDKAESAGD